MDGNYNKLEFECCFCNQGIESNKTDPCDINVLINFDKVEDRQYSQNFFCHLMCLKAKLSPKIPLYLEHILEDE